MLKLSMVTIKQEAALALFCYLFLFFYWLSMSRAPRFSSRHSAHSRFFFLISCDKIANIDFKIQSLAIKVVSFKSPRTADFCSDIGKNSHVTMMKKLLCLQGFTRIRKRFRPKIDGDSVKERIGLGIDGEQSVYHSKVNSPTVGENKASWGIWETYGEYNKMYVNIHKNIASFRGNCKAALMPCKMAGS